MYKRLYISGVEQNEILVPRSNGLRFYKQLRDLNDGVAICYVYSASFLAYYILYTRKRIFRRDTIAFCCIREFIVLQLHAQMHRNV